MGSDEAVTRQAYRCVWVRASAVVLAVGGLVLAAVWAIGSPWTFAAVLALGWLAQHLRLPSRSARALRQVWEHHAGPALPDPSCAYLLALLPAFLLAAVGWNILLGGAGTVIVLADGLLGLPLIYLDDDPEPRSTTPTTTTSPTELAEWVGSGTVVDLVATSIEAGDEAPGLAEWSGPRTLLPALSDTELWHAWKASTHALGCDLSAEARARIVAARARYLDALIERDPDGLAGRLAADAPLDWTSFDFPT